MSQAFRFLHVSDLRLGDPVLGVRDPSDALREAILRAPYAAAEAAFEVALREQVEFVLLTGDALDLRQPSPRPLSFLQRQFQRLTTAGIEVYWCSGEIDPLERWPRSLELPSGVTTFATPSVEVVRIQNNKQALCTLLAAGRNSHDASLRALDFRAVSDTGLVIGAVNGDVDLDSLEELPCHYWALGGRHHRKMVAKENRLAVYAGTPQPRDPSHPGPGGVNLVSIDPARAMHSKEISCERLRFVHESLEIESGKLEGLRDRIGERMLELATEADDAWWVVDWKLITDTSAPGGFTSPSQRQTLIAWMRKEFSGRNGGIWCNSLDIETPADRIPKSILEEDSILGDFLRSIPSWEEDETRLLDLVGDLVLPTELQTSGWHERLQQYDRTQLLSVVRRLGLEMLGGEGE